MKQKDLIHGNTIHGVKSGTVRQRFDDLRTSEGKALSEAMDALVTHFGGAEHISAPMQVLLDAAIRPKLIILMIISEWVNKQGQLINTKGELPPVLGSHYIAYCNGLRRDLMDLVKLAADAGMKAKPPSISDLISGEPK